MSRFYLKIQNKIFINNLLYIITFLVLIFNIILRIFPKKFITFPNGNIITAMTPRTIYVYCDGYLLVLFIILIFFFLGVDFYNSVEEITLAIGGSKINKFMARKLGALLLLYFALYALSFANIYTLYIKFMSNNHATMPFKEILFYSLCTNIFIISVSLFILFLFRDITISTSLITAYYLIEEVLWRCKVTQKKGILGHVYQYFDYEPGELFKIKLLYLLAAIVLLFLTRELSSRKNRCVK